LLQVLLEHRWIDNCWKGKKKHHDGKKKWVQHYPTGDVIEATDVILHRLWRGRYYVTISGLKNACHSKLIPEMSLWNFRWMYWIFLGTCKEPLPKHSSGWKGR
jgi:hypothetical protein